MIESITRRLRLAALPLVTALSLLLSCGEAAPPEAAAIPPPTPTPINVQQLLQAIGEATAALETFHFRLEHNRGGTPLALNLTVTEVEGDVVNPDAISTDFSGTLGAFAVRSSLITIGEESYMTNPLTGAWESVPREVSPLGFFDPTTGIGAMIAGIERPRLLASDGGHFRLAGSLPVNSLEPLLGGAAHGTTVEVVLTVDARTSLLKQAVLDGRVTADEPEGVVRTVTLSRFNEPVSIDPPR